MTRSTEEVLELASVDPERALRLAESLQIERPGMSDRERGILYRAMSLASGRLGRFPDAIDLAERAQAMAKNAGDDEQRVLAIVTLVPPMAIMGRSDEAMNLIDASTHLATTSYLDSRLTFQRGVVWGMKGEPTRAIEAFETSLPAFREAEDSEMIRGALHGLGLRRLETGDLSQAERDLEEALAIAESRNEEPIVSGIKHNLGLLASYRGDITEALRLLLESDEIYMRLTRSSTPQHVARSEVLLSAGLFREAYQLAKEIADHHRASNDPEHLANALLVAARAALLGGDLEGALATAEEAAAVFEDRQRPTHAVDARRIAIEARYGIDGASEDLIRVATEVAVALESEKQVVAAVQARFLVGRIAIDLGDIDEAQRWLEPVSKVESGPVELRVQGRLASARLRLLKGNFRGADAAARSGLRLIDGYQRALGATDLRMGIEQHAAELGTIGLDLALNAGDSRRVLRWMEWTRARALRHRPVVAEHDEEVRDALGRLRQIEAELRERHDSRLQRERRAIQERIRNADRLKLAGAQSDAKFDVDALIAELGDRIVLEIAIHDDRLVGVLVSGGRVRRLELGESEPALRELAHVRFAMRRAARRGRALDSGALQALDRLLFGNTRLNEAEVIVVPPPRLMAAPWAALPTLRERVVTISPSAEMWWQARQRTLAGDRVIVAGGPDLEFADREVSEIASLHCGSIAFPPGSTVEEVKGSLQGASIAHVVSHANFRAENPMFSSLRLGDGDLNVYDIERLQTPPAVVVMSACDSGYTETMAGDELAGLTSALLTMGTRSIVASVGLVPDSSATASLMAHFHRGLVSGLEPAKALARARVATVDDPAGFIAAASFICVGA